MGESSVCLSAPSSCGNGAHHSGGAVFPVLMLSLALLCEGLYAQCLEQRIDPSNPYDLGYFGTAVDVRGERAVITTMSHEAVVLDWDGSQWRETASLPYEGPGYGLSYGYAVALGQDVVAVGDPSDTYDGQRGAGAVHVFRLGSSGWGREAVLGAPDGHGYAHFGSSVALFSSGQEDLLVVGAPDTRVGSKTPGTAYLFRFSEGQWSEEAEFTPSNMKGGEVFGDAVATDGDRVVVGAPEAESTARKAGAAFVYRFDGTDWVEEAVLNPSSGDDAYDYFGDAVALQGELLAVGITGEDSGAQAAGAVACYTYNGSDWDLEAVLVGSAPEEARRLGFSLDLDDERIVSGGGLGAYSRGNAVLFARNRGDWEEISLLIPPDQENLDQYGWAVALDGPCAIIGAPGKSGGRWKSGVAYSWCLAAAEPAWWSSYGDGWPGTHGVPDLELSGEPRIGDEIDLFVSNSLGIPTVGLLLIGLRPDSTETGLGGQLLVAPRWSMPVILPGQGLVAPLRVPCDRALGGLVLYGQVLEEDRGASRGVSFTRGLAMGIGR